MSRLIMRYGTRLFFIFAVGAGVTLWMIETTASAGFALSLKLLSIPLAAVVFGFTYANREALSSRKRPWQVWSRAVAFYILAILLSWPYLLAVNTIFPTDETVEFRGLVVDKSGYRRHRRSYQVRILEAQSGHTVTVGVSRREYERISVGELYSTCFKRGWLGIPFRWKRSAPLQCPQPTSAVHDPPRLSAPDKRPERP